MLLLLAACLCSASVGACLGFAIASMLAVAKASDKASERIAVMGRQRPHHEGSRHIGLPARPVPTL